MLSICDVIVSQKTYNGEQKQHFFGRDNNFTHSLCTKITSLWKYKNRALIMWKIGERGGIREGGKIFFSLVAYILHCMKKA